MSVKGGICNVYSVRFMCCVYITLLTVPSYHVCVVLKYSYLSNYPIVVLNSCSWFIYYRVEINVGFYK